LVFDRTAVTLHNTHLFVGPAFELQRHGTPGTVDAIPFLVEVEGRGLAAQGIRMEACSPFVARHTGGFSDARYEVAYVGTYGFLGCAVDYQGATRAGGTVVPHHQAAAAIGTPRLVAAAENVRSRAFRWRRGTTAAVSPDHDAFVQETGVLVEVGFEGMAMLSGNPVGPPATLAGFCFAGLDGIGLNAETVLLPTSRAMAFVVDSSLCKEFFVAAEGSDLRIVVQQFDASEALLGEGYPVLLSNMNVLPRFPTSTPASNACWWEGNADLGSLTGGLALNRLQRVTLHAAARFAVIGVRGGSATAVLKALRLYGPATEAPQVLAGGGRLWGAREISASLAYDPPNLAAGALAIQAVAVPNIQGGDFVQASHSAVSGYIDWTAAVSTTGAAGTVTARATNRHPSTAIDLAAGTLFVRAVKPRL
jgi:hypothetical protein